MQNIKNFSLVEPTPSQREAFKNGLVIIPYFLKSEDGRDWYECQRLFSDDTVKIAYDADGIIRSVVDVPVPQRGNVYAVSMLWPLNLSVAEIAVADYPETVVPDGTWKYDGDQIYQDTDIVDANTLAANTTLRDKYALSAILAISAIQCSAAIGNPHVGDTDSLLALQQYMDRLRGADLTITPAAPPVMLSSL